MAKMWDWVLPGSGSNIHEGGRTVMVGNKTFQHDLTAANTVIPASGQAPRWMSNLTLEYVYGPGPNSSGKWEAWGS